MYQYAAGDIRGITTELVRGPTPEAAKAQCIARGVPAEHVETWAVRSEASEHAEEVRALEGRVRHTEGIVSQLEVQVSDLRDELQAARDDQRAVERKRDALQSAIDTALSDLYRIQTGELCALDAGRLERAIKALGDV